MPYKSTLKRFFQVICDPNVWSNLDKWDLEHKLNNESLDLGIQNLSIMPYDIGKKMCVNIT